MEVGENLFLTFVLKQVVSAAVADRCTQITSGSRWGVALGGQLRLLITQSLKSETVTR